MFDRFPKHSYQISHCLDSTFQETSKVLAPPRLASKAPSWASPDVNCLTSSVLSYGCILIACLDLEAYPQPSPVTWLAPPRLASFTSPDVELLPHQAKNPLPLFKKGHRIVLLLTTPRHGWLPQDWPEEPFPVPRRMWSSCPSSGGGGAPAPGQNATTRSSINYLDHLL